jgi:hypothetical protein
MTKNQQRAGSVEGSETGDLRGGAAIKADEKAPSPRVVTVGTC